MAVTDYCVIDGEVVSEIRNGTERDYVPDPLGSTVALLDNTQTKTDTFTYWPYGEVRSSTGSNVTPFRFVGTLGYYKDTISRTYVRAREYQQNYGRWMTVDFAWPRQHAYRYGDDSPVKVVDPSGTWPTYVNCPEDLVNKINYLCLLIYVSGNDFQYKVNRCIQATRYKSGIPCGYVTDNRLKCLQAFCDSSGTIKCGPIPGGAYGSCPGFRPGDRTSPTPNILLDPSPGSAPWGYTYATWLQGSALQVTFLHELMHACGQAHVFGQDSGLYQCNDIQACCLFEVLSGNDGHRCSQRIPANLYPTPTTPPPYIGGGSYHPPLP